MAERSERKSVQVGLRMDEQLHGEVRKALDAWNAVTPYGHLTMTQFIESALELGLPQLKERTESVRQVMAKRPTKDDEAGKRQ